MYSATWADNVAQQLVKSVTFSTVQSACGKCHYSLQDGQTCQRQLQKRLREETEEDKRLKHTMAVLKDFGLEDTNQYKEFKKEYESNGPEFHTYTCGSKKVDKHENVIDHVDSSILNVWNELASSTSK